MNYLAKLKDIITDLQKAVGYPPTAFYRKNT